MVNGNREAFRPGTEPTGPRPASPSGNAGAVIAPRNGSAAPVGAPPVAGAPPAPPKKAPADLNGLY
jgi:hypothetical protein